MYDTGIVGKTKEKQDALQFQQMLSAMNRKERREWSKRLGVKVPASQIPVLNTTKKATKRV